MRDAAKPEAPTVERTTISLDGKLTAVAHAYAKREFIKSFSAVVEKALTQMLTREGMLPAEDAVGVEDLLREALRVHGAEPVRAKLNELVQAALTREAV